MIKRITALVDHNNDIGHSDGQDHHVNKIMMLRLLMIMMFMTVK